MGTECRSTSYLSLKVSIGVQTYCFSMENPGNCLKRRGGRSTHGIRRHLFPCAKCNFGNMPGSRKSDTPYSRCVWRGWGGWLGLVRGVFKTSVSSRWLSSDHCSNYTTVNSAETQQIGTVKVTCLPCATTCAPRYRWSGGVGTWRIPVRPRGNWRRRPTQRRWGPSSLLTSCNAVLFAEV
jgi:hypothetical protein